MLSSRPYLIRALYDWLVDQSLTPMLLISSEILTEQGKLPPNAEMMLYNISPQAVRDFAVDEQAVRFQARFGTEARNVIIDPRCVIRVFCRENDYGVTLPIEVALPPDDNTPGGNEPEHDPPHLRLVR